MKANEFDNRIVAVVGGTEGIGPAVARGFAEQGARVVIGDTSTGESNSTLDIAPGAKITTLTLDLTDSDSIKRFFQQCSKDVGDPEIVFVSAQSVKTSRVLELTPEELRNVVDRELVGAALVMQEAARRMVPRGAGRIVAVASMSGKTGVHPGVGPYAAAKGGLIAFARVMAAELASTGVTVNVIATALFEPQVAAIPEDRRAELSKAIPVGRFGRPQEAAHAVLFLASEDGAFVTGETLNLSGGRFMD